MHDSWCKEHIYIEHLQTYIFMAPAVLHAVKKYERFRSKLLFFKCSKLRNKIQKKILSFSYKKDDYDMINI